MDAVTVILEFVHQLTNDLKIRIIVRIIETNRVNQRNLVAAACNESFLGEIIALKHYSYDKGLGKYI